MKHFRNTFLLLLLLAATTGHAQVSPERQAVLMKEAAAYMNSTQGKPYNPGKAFALHMECAKAGNAEAMNAVGIHYGEGTGAATDLAEAMKWYQLAAGNGYARGWYNVGKMYQGGFAVPQDFTKAYASFSKSAFMGDMDSKYMVAYLHFKGLGCQQDYARAYQLFYQSAQAGHSNSMYFLGLCLRNGYGVPKNIDAARLWLQKAAAKGNQQAREELNSKEPENPSTPLQLPPLAANTPLFKTIGNDNTINGYNRVKHNVTKEDLFGIYKGFAIRYDWSGKHIIAITPLELDIHESDKVITGNWKEEDTDPIAITAALTEDALVFSNTKINKTGHYSGSAGELWQFIQAHMQVAKTPGNIYIAGNLQLYSDRRKEPGKPMYVILSRNSETIRPAEADILTQVQAFPNPLSSYLTVQFTITETSAVSIRITSMEGKTLHTEAAATLLPGSYRRSFAINGAAGNYAVKITAGTASKSIVVVKQ